MGRKKCYTAVICKVLGLILLLVCSWAHSDGYSAEKLFEKGERYFKQERWNKAKKFYEHLLEKKKDDPFVSQKGVAIQERLMRCEFYINEFDFEEVFKEETGVSDFQLKDGRVPYIEMKYDFNSENSANMFQGAEVKDGLLVQTGEHIVCGFKFRTPFIMEVNTQRVPSAGMFIYLFVRENFKGDVETYAIYLGRSRRFNISAGIYKGEEELAKIRGGRYGINSRGKITVSKMRGRIRVGAGEITLRAVDSQYSTGYIGFSANGDAMFDIKFDDITFKSRVNGAWWRSFKGDLEGDRWIEFKQEYEKENSVAGSDSDEEDQEEEESKLNPLTIILGSIEAKKDDSISGEDVELFTKCMALFHEKKYNRIEELMGDAVSKHSDYYLWYYLRGIARMYNSDTEGSREDLTKSQKLNPDNPVILFGLGLLNIKQKKYEKAAQAFNRSTEIQEDFISGYIYECLAIFYSDDIGGAQKKMTEYSGRFPDNELMKAGNKMFYLLKHGPQWVDKYRSEGQHYIVLSEISRSNANEIKRYAEAIYNKYVGFFPSINRSKDKYKIFVFKSFGSFADYAIDSGEMPPHPGIGGLYHPLLDHLLIRGDKEKHDILGTVFHEGLHQYLEYYIENAPIWFNEGLATFFEASYFDSKGFHAGVLNKDRLRDLKEAMKSSHRLRPRGRRGRSEEIIPDAELQELEDIMLSDASAFMGDMGNQTIVNYAQAWSLVYFFIMNEKMMDHFLKPYFDLLHEGRSKEEAYKEVMEPHIDEIERLWKDYYRKEKYK